MKQRTLDCTERSFLQAEVVLLSRTSQQLFYSHKYGILIFQLRIYLVCSTEEKLMKFVELATVDISGK